MQAFGWTNPLLVDPSGEIIAGEARYLAARQLGLQTAPVIVLPGLSAAQRDAYRIADNRIAEYATWNEDLLAEVLADLERDGFDVSLTGFSERTIAELIAGATGVHDAVADAVVPPPAVAITRPGDLWQLGRHRLICGDSTKRETLIRLLGGRLAQVTILDPPGDATAEAEQADLVFTDPPYGMSYQNKAHGGILGDDARGAELIGLVGRALAEAKAAARQTAAFYVCLTWRTYGEFAQALTVSGLRPAACIVWDKGSIGPGTLHYRPQHEFIFYCPGAPGGVWNGGQGESDVWHLARAPAGTYVHPTQKPVGLIERAIENSSRAGDIVLDCFGGSGSTLIAAERAGRLARLVELDPRFCDAILRRYEQYTGDRPIRLDPPGE